MHQPPGFENTTLRNFKRFGGPSGCSAVEPLMEAPAAPQFEDDVDESDYYRVLGILGRITPENYDAMKAQLIALPIRQLTDEEITEVVKMMHNKAVRPEDALYTEMYARLMADLVHHTGVHGVGKTIRKAIIDKCQHQFEQPFVLPDEDRVDAEGNPLPDEDIQIKSMQLKERLKCNIKFLGHLFLCGMVNEKVVNFVLFHLLYGKEDSTKHTKRRPEEYEVEMFCDLLKKVGKNLTPKTQQDYLPGYMKSLENLRAKTSKRLMFMLMDLEELWRSGWEPRTKQGQVAGPMKLAEFEKRDAEMRQKEQQDIERALQQQQRGGGRVTNAPTSPKTPAPRTVVEVAPLPTKDSVYGVMESYTADGASSIIEAFFKPIPAKERLPYLTHWMARIVKVAKKEEDRKKIGEVVEVLTTVGLMKPDEIEKAFLEIADKIVGEALYEDMPKLFNWWFDLVASCKKVPSPAMHTQLLRRLIRGGEYPVSKDVIVQMIVAVLESPDPNINHRDPQRRFRPLPAILTYANPLPNPNMGRDEVDEEEADTGDDDLLASVLQRISKDPELTVFEHLTTGTTSQDLVSFITMADSRTEATFAPRVISALFTYARCDTTNNVIAQFREPIQALFKSGPTTAAALVAEVYLTWRELGRLPAPACQRFVEKLKEFELVRPQDLVQAWSLVQKVDSSAESDFSHQTGYQREQRQERQPGSPATAAPMPRGRGGR